MKKIIAVSAILVLAGTQLQTAQAGEGSWSAGFFGYSGGGVSFGVGYNTAPPVVVARAPVVCAPRPVVACAPAPMIACRPSVVYAPVVCAPPVVVVRPAHGYGYGYGYGYRHGYRHGHGPRGHW
jgi:hypothetical protein